jgi:NAD(P) transhydrogenase subunit alpha
MDILSSQNNLSGYKAALVAINNINRSVPMMITAAGTLLPLKILIWGLGVAGLQAAATLKKVGAKVYASDIREETKDQALSVGAIFIDSENICKYSII